MPWCAGCDRFLSPSTVTEDGRCPRCGAGVDPGAARAPEPAASPGLLDGDTSTPAPADPAPADPGEEPLPLPWHFKLLVGAITFYLGWRAFQGVEWVVHRL